MMEQSLLDAIEQDDLAKVKELLRLNRTLARFQVAKPRLYKSGILHWLYVGDTPLHLASAGHRVDIARYLLTTGADPNSTANHRQSSPLHYAADGCVGNPIYNARTQVETIRCLLDAGAHINDPDRNGATPLHRAVRTRSVAAVRCLLDAGCDPVVRNKPGSTPFHLAVQNTGRGGSGSDAAKTAQREIIGEFISRGVSLKLKDGRRNTVLDCARSDWVREILNA